MRATSKAITKMILGGGVLFIFLVLLSAPSKGFDCSWYTGSPYNCVEEQSGYATLQCCYTGLDQYYYYKNQGINYDHGYQATCDQEAPCDHEQIKAVYGSFVTKFSWMYQAVSGGANNCPTTPATRWKPLSYGAGWIFSSGWIDLFDNAGKE